MNSPGSRPEKPKRPEPRPGLQVPAPVNPDPKAHPFHPATPPHPLREGTDPKTPVKTKGFVTGDPGDGA
jgi:hypothetical protein